MSRKSSGRRPRAVGRPVTREMHRAIIGPSYLALVVLTKSTDHGALVQARHALASLFNYLSVAGTMDGRDVEQVQEGLRAVMSMDARYERVRTYRATGEELAVLRAAVGHCDRMFGLLRTDVIEAARRQVNATLGRR